MSASSSLRPTASGSLGRDATSSRCESPDASRNGAIIDQRSRLPCASAVEKDVQTHDERRLPSQLDLLDCWVAERDAATIGQDLELIGCVCLIVVEKDPPRRPVVPNALPLDQAELVAAECQRVPVP